MASVPDPEAQSPGPTGAVNEAAIAAGATQSLLLEMRAARDSAIGHIRKVAATATTETQLSAASVTRIVAAALIAFALAVITWICLLALGIWLAVQAGWPVWAALAGAIGVNIFGMGACWFWYSRLVPNIGFSRTRGLLFPRGAG
jgi:hypothetical protein